LITDQVLVWVKETGADGGMWQIGAALYILYGTYRGVSSEARQAEGARLKGPRAGQVLVEGGQVLRGWGGEEQALRHCYRGATGSEKETMGLIKRIKRTVPLTSETISSGRGGTGGP
jgi:hypothetical protein